MSVSVCAVGGGGLPDVLLLVDVVVVLAVYAERGGTAAEQMLPLLNGNDRRRGFLICSLHNCISFLLFNIYSHLITTFLPLLT